MSHVPPEDAELTAETEAALSDLLAAQPGIPMPPEVRDRLRAVLLEEAATRAALTSNDAEPTEVEHPLTKATDPALDREDLY